MAKAPLTTNEAAKALGVAADTVRLYERQGKLLATRTQGGMRLFKPADVERLRRQRAAGGSDSKDAA